MKKYTIEQLLKIATVMTASDKVNELKIQTEKRRVWFNTEDNTVTVEHFENGIAMRPLAEYTALEIYTMHCIYCAHTWQWEFKESDFDEVADLYHCLEFNQEITCPKCSCSVRINEGLEEVILKKEGWL